MSDVTDAQDLATTNAKADALDDNNTGSVAVPIQPAADIAAFTVVSGTAKQVNATRNATLLCNITTSASLTISMGPTSAADTSTVHAAQSSALGMVTLYVPRGWYVKFTGTVSNYAIKSILHN